MVFKFSCLYADLKNVIKGFVDTYGDAIEIEDVHLYSNRMLGFKYCLGKVVIEKHALNKMKLKNIGAVEHLMDVDAVAKQEMNSSVTFLHKIPRDQWDRDVNF